MKIIQLKKDGTMLQKDLAYFGGKYSLWERLRLGGIGTPRVMYLGGLDYFDELNDQVINEISFVNFELMKNGLLIRLNRNQKLRYVGYQLQEIKSIWLVNKASKGSTNQELFDTSELIYEAHLTINFVEDQALNFGIEYRNTDKIQQFFVKHFAKHFKIDIEFN